MRLALWLREQLPICGAVYGNGLVKKRSVVGWTAEAEFKQSFVKQFDSWPAIHLCLLQSEWWNISFNISADARESLLATYPFSYLINVIDLTSIIL
jgi:hypothetical protein